jgi:hypothetical protein
VVSRTAAAPSVIWLALPAVTVPPSRNAGLSRASASSVVSARGPSSRSSTTSFTTGLPPGPFSLTDVATGTSSASNFPACWAATAFMWLW